MYAIQTRQLRKSYGTGATAVEVLKGINLDIRQGEFVSIMGPSGSGKSTLLNMVGLLDTPSGGAMRIMERRAQKLSKNQRAEVRQQTIGFVFQAFHLLPRATALQNVMLPMALAGVKRSARRKKAEATLRAVGLGDRMKNKPSELSGGQKQRVAIARAIALDPPILLADEPTGNLDSKTSEEIMRLFQSLHRNGKTVIQVTHEPTMARFGQRIIRFQDGVIAANEQVAQ